MGFASGSGRSAPIRVRSTHPTAALDMIRAASQRLGEEVAHQHVGFAAELFVVAQRAGVDGGITERMHGAAEHHQLPIDLGIGHFVLEQARAGADFKAVVVFHVTNPNPVVTGTPCNIKGRVLAIHGSADPVTPKPMMDAFEEELTNAKIDWQVMMFGGAVHSFCDPTVHAGPTRYDEKLCRKSYMLMRDFFAETH